MEEIWNGVLRAIELIATLNPEVLEITARSLLISLSAVFLAAAIGIPLGALIELREFRGKKALVNLIQTLYGLPTVTVGLLVFLILSRSGPLGNLELL
ncbi:MAG: ABC transporter permease, partial [Methanothrix sp.]|nr:ABC transporter permease [Methanothrix sp.]